MLEVGLTGGIGSGKSTIAKIFQHFGIPVYYSDDRSKILLDTDDDLKSAVCRAFGLELIENDMINKKALAKIVFSDKSELQKLNALVHPKVAIDYNNWKSTQTNKYVLKEAAILFESGSYEEMDKVILVKAPVEMRIARVMRRDGVGRASVVARMKNQWSDERKTPLSDFIIYNDEQRSILIQSAIIHRKLVNLVG